MACDMLIKATDNGDYLKGYPVAIKDHPAVWGSKEGLPTFVHVVVTDRDKEQLQQYFDPWPIKFVHTVIDNQPEYWRVKVEVDQAYVNASETSKDVMKNEMINFLQEDYIGGYSITFTASSVTFNLPKTTDPQLVKSAFADAFDDIFDIRRYYLRSGVVNYIVGQGGTVETDYSTLTSYINDKLDD